MMMLRPKGSIPTGMENCVPVAYSDQNLNSWHELELISRLNNKYFEPQHRALKAELVRRGISLIRQHDGQHYLEENRYQRLKEERNTMRNPMPEDKAQLTDEQKFRLGSQQVPGEPSPINLSGAGPGAAAQQDLVSKQNETIVSDAEADKPALEAAQKRQDEVVKAREELPEGQDLTDEHKLEDHHKEVLTKYGQLQVDNGQNVDKQQVEANLAVKIDDLRSYGSSARFDQDRAENERRAGVSGAFPHDATNPADPINDPQVKAAGLVPEDAIQNQSPGEVQEPNDPEGPPGKLLGSKKSGPATPREERKPGFYDDKK